MPVVSPLAMTMLGTGDWIISQVKAAAPHGSGNNHVPHTGHCEAGARTEVVLDGSREMFKAKTGEMIKNDWHRPMRRAAYVIACGAGNCQDLAALAYCYCRDSFINTADIKFVVNRSFGHAYVIVTMDSEQIVVDPWPLHAQAVMVADHFCGTNYSEIQKQGSGIGLTSKTSRVATARARATSLSWTSSSSYACTRQYTHQSCASSGGWITYTSS